MQSLVYKSSEVKGKCATCKYKKHVVGAGQGRMPLRGIIWQRTRCVGWGIRDGERNIKIQCSTGVDSGLQGESEIMLRNCE